jgi:cellulose synthase operon protein C
VGGADPVQAALLTARIFLRQGLDGEALERFDAALARLEGAAWSEAHTAALTGRARALLRLNRLDDARAAAEAVRAHAPDHLENLQVLGEALLQQGDAAEAVRVFSHACELSPRDPGLLRHLGRAALAPAAAATRSGRCAAPSRWTPISWRRAWSWGGCCWRPGGWRTRWRSAAPRSTCSPPTPTPGSCWRWRTGPPAGPARRWTRWWSCWRRDPYHLSGLVLLGRRCSTMDGGGCAARAGAGAAVRPRPRGGALPPGRGGGGGAALPRGDRPLARRGGRRPDGPLADAARENIATALDVAQIFRTGAAPVAAQTA